METLLKTGYCKIMNLFYRNKKQSFHLREIARKTKLNENGVSRYLKELEKQGILKSEKQGNFKNFFVINGKSSFSLFSLFDVIKFNKLPCLRKDAIGYFLGELKKQPVFVVLFGSTAKETFLKKSDIDLFFVVNSKIDINEAESYSESQTGINLSTISTYFNYLKNQELITNSRKPKRTVNNIVINLKDMV